MTPSRHALIAAASLLSAFVTWPALAQEAPPPADKPAEAANPLDKIKEKVRRKQQGEGQAQDQGGAAPQQPAAAPNRLDQIRERVRQRQQGGPAPDAAPAEASPGAKFTPPIPRNAAQPDAAPADQSPGAKFTPPTPRNAGSSPATPKVLNAPGAAAAPAAASDTTSDPADAGRRQSRSRPAGSAERGGPPPAATTAQPSQPAPAAAPAGPAPMNIEALKNARSQTTEAGGKRVIIQEPDKRTIVRQDNRMVIQQDETERLRRIAPNAQVQTGAGGATVSTVERPGGVKIVSETDSNGQLVRRYRRDGQGRETTIIDNRRRNRSSLGRDIAVGAGIGLGVAAGAAILNSVVSVPKPRVSIPREKYIVDYDRASEEDVYEALSAPPVDRITEVYTLDQVRATPRLRDRMRRVDLDDINFEFGSWRVDSSEYHKLERVARAMRRVIRRNPNEVFLIEGYTDAVGSNVDNLTLSDRRAESVAVILAEQFDVPFENLTTQGYGEDYLKIPTQAPERANRRVAVRRITPLLSREGDLARGDDEDRGPRRRDRYDDRRYDDRGYDDRRGRDPGYDEDRRYDDRRGGDRYPPYRGEDTR